MDISPSFAQAVGSLKEKLAGTPCSTSSCRTALFSADCRSSDTISSSLVANLAGSWENLSETSMFVFMNRDFTSVYVGFGPSSFDRPDGVQFIASQFEERSVSVRMTPLVLLSTSASMWPRVSISATEAGVETNRILDSLSHSFMGGDSAHLLPPCKEMRESGLKFDEYKAVVATCISEMKKGELNKVVLSRRVSFEMCAPVNPFALLHQVLSTTAASDSGKRYVLAYSDGSECFISVTPERMCRVTDGVVETEALAGTCPNSDGFEMTEKLDDEHGTVTSYVTETLQQLGEFPVEVTDREFVKLRDMTHCRQRFRMETTKNTSTLTDWCVSHLHPTPAVAGIPKNRACALISENELFLRKFFAAPIGIISHSESELCVGLRSAVVRGATVDVFAGAGLVRDSDPAAEWAEMDLKMAQFRNVLLASNRPCFKTLGNNATQAQSMFVIEELVRNGATSFIVCPGSRSTPLTVAVRMHSVAHARSIVVHDERCAGFYAEGVARAGGLPVLIVTSGTAVANLMPGVCEAAEAGLALVLLTADRPARSWGVGEYQTVKQVGMFSNYVGFEKNFPAPVSEAATHFASALLPSVLSDVSFAVGDIAVQRRQSVHLNFEFEKPELQPVKLDDSYADKVGNSLHPRLRRYVESLEPYTVFSRPNRSHSFGLPQTLLTALQYKKCAIVCGELRVPNDAIALNFFCAKRNILCIAEPTSLMPPSEHVLFGSDQLLADPALVAAMSEGIEWVIRVGGPLISARLQDWSSSIGRTVRIFDDRFSRNRHDPQHAAEHYIHAPLEAVILEIDSRLNQNVVTEQHVIEKIAKSINSLYLRSINACAWNEAIIAAVFSEHAVKANAAVFLSSSMPCRDFNIFGSLHAASECTHRLVASNRGANGIDGVISSAAGYAASTNTQTYLLIGDVATLHDISGLSLALNVHPGHLGEKMQNMKIVCVNNSGGAIFSFLPIRNHTDVFSPFFDTPHSIDFTGIANAMLPGCAVKVDSVAGLTNALNDDGIRFIECVALPGHDENVDIHKALGSTVCRGLLGIIE